MTNLHRGLILFALIASTGAGSSVAQSQDSALPLFSQMRWREIGPMRAGRTRALAGVASQPATFYIGGVNGGVWKTTDGGATWNSLWDAQPSGSIGAIAVADSDPNIVYVGSGEGLQRPDLSTGDGVYKSTDAGKTWIHLLGLRDGQQIGQLAIDPKNPDKVFVAVTGHPYGPNKERGLYRTLDGGNTWKNVLYIDDLTGASDVEIDPSNPKIVYAGMWQRQEGPWENGAFIGDHGGMFRSTDGGDTFTKVTGGGLPDDVLQVNIAIAPSDSNRIYAEVARVSGGVLLMRSDDGGKTWVHAPVNDTRPEARIGGGDVPVPRVDPKDPNTIIVASVVSWRSTDAGKTWFGLRGSPGGDDYQNVYINPNNTDIIALVSDQGAIVSMNRGESWTQWYNQPTAQMYHATVDNAFPYRVCGGQQDSGSACVDSRGNDGRITFHDWHPVGIEEYGYAAPDPLDPDLVYGGKVTRYNRKTGQIQDVEPKALRGYRALRTEPLQFSAADPHNLYFATNTLWLTKNGGLDWKEISPDLSRETYDLPDIIGTYKSNPAASATRRGVIYALGLSPLDVNRIWAGTDDGLIWTTSDGGANWSNVTPPEMKPFWKVFNMDAGHFDKLTDYAAVNTLRLDDMRPHLFRTHDGGKTWKEIDNGIPDGAATSAIREDPKRKGLLYAGSETQVYVSFDDGDHWHSLRLNMAAVSVRDLEVKDDDLVAATHGRGYLILDNVTPLRQYSERLAAENAHLYTPQTSIRVRNDMNPPTPWPPEMATGENPPDGAMIDYYLGPHFAGAVTLEVMDSKGETVSKFSSADPVPPLDPRYPDPVLWAQKPRVVETTPGHHRFLWDMHYAAVPGMSTGPDAGQAVPHNTPAVSSSPWVMPGEYTIKMVAGGKTFTTTMKVVLDPRVKTSQADLEKQFAVSKKMYDQMMRATTAIHEATVLRDQMKADNYKGPGGASANLESKLEAIIGVERGEERGGGRRGGPPRAPTLGSARMQLARLEHEIQAADEAPTTTQIEAAEEAGKPIEDLLQKWDAVKKNDVKALNEMLLQKDLPLLTLDTHIIDHDVEDQIEYGDDD
ncbi:MAG TPA: glycoside hydrolase [Acidobacteriaceae bacterium]|nr:glycoside hydrolase [Acidobacteriaceae bacterium]